MYQNLSSDWFGRVGRGRGRGEFIERIRNFQSSNFHDSVLQGNISEEIGHGLSVVDSANGFGQKEADVDRPDTVATALAVVVVGDGVGHYHLKTQKMSFRECGPA